MVSTLENMNPPTWARVSYILIGLTILALLVRLVFFAEYTLEGTDCDGAAYMKLADNISTGKGWCSNSLRSLFLPPESLPEPDAHWSPLYPLLTAIAFWAFGNSFAVAKLVPLLFGTLLPSAVFLLCRELTRSWRAGLMAGTLSLVYPTLVGWSLRIETEIASIFLIALTYFLLINPRARDKPHWVGLLLGLAYLMKYQHVLLWPAVILFYLLNTPRRVALRRLAVAAIVFAAVISPWLLRNTVVFGDPFYSDLRYNILAFYPELGGQKRYFSSLEMPPTTLEYFRTHPGEVLRHTFWGIRGLLRGFVSSHAGSNVLLPLALLGLPAVWKRWKRWAPAILYALLLVGACGVSMPLPRYILVLIPFWIALVVAGAQWLMNLGDRACFRTRHPWYAIVLAVLLVVVTDQARTTVSIVKDKTSVWSPSACFCVLETQSVADYIREYTVPGESVFCTEAFHCSLILNRNCILIPFTERELCWLSERYDTRYMIIATRDLRKRLPEWEEDPPSWARLVHRIPAEGIRRPPRNPTYAHVSEMRIYRLDECAN